MKLKNHITALAALAVLSACDVLDQSPTNNVSDDEVATSASAATTVLNGAYHRLATSNYYGGGYFTTIVALASDNTEWVGSYNFLGNFDQHNYQADNTANESAWYNIYAAINAANQTIKLTAQAAIAETERRRIIAEATVIRSLALFDLARTWGNIFIIKEATTSPTQFDGVKQSDATTVYQTVVADLLAVHGDLASPAQRANVYISQPVADAFLARVYLYLQDWANAEKYASLVIALTDYYQLVPISEFLANKQTRESIFELTYSSSFSNEFYYYWQRSGGGRQEIGLSPELYNLVASPETGGDRALLVSDDSTPTERLLTCKLYWRDANDDDPSYVFRLAEQYLIRAEARAQSGNIDGAVSDLNAIRQRSHVADYSGSTAQADVLDAIAQERRIELAFEPHRWFDLVRTGKAAATLRIDSHYTLFPIPNNDRVADNDIVQNAGY